MHPSRGKGFGQRIAGGGGEGEEPRKTQPEGAIHQRAGSESQATWCEMRCEEADMISGHELWLYISFIALLMVLFAASPSSAAHPSLLLRLRTLSRSQDFQQEQAL